MSVLLRSAQAKGVAKLRKGIQQGTSFVNEEKLSPAYATFPHYDFNNTIVTAKFVVPNTDIRRLV